MILEIIIGSLIGLGLGVAISLTVFYLPFKWLTQSKLADVTDGEIQFGTIEYLNTLYCTLMHKDIQIKVRHGAFTIAEMKKKQDELDEMMKKQDKIDNKI
jgi:hypothetical protein